MLFIYMYIHVCRSTPVEVLHTVLLGPYKYLTAKVMASLNKQQKEEILAVLDTHDYSGITGRMSSNITTYSKSFVGRDFKVWAQIAPFVLKRILSDEMLKLWICLSHVSVTSYTDMCMCLNCLINACHPIAYIL